MKIVMATRAETVTSGPDGRLLRFINKHLLPHPARLNILARLVGVADLFYKLAPGFLTRYLPYTQGVAKRVTPDFLGRSLRSTLPAVNPGHAPPSAGRARRVAYFSGCMTDLAFPGTGASVVDTLNRAGVDVVFPKEQVCCGAPAWFGGDMDTARELAESNIKTLDALDVDGIVISCATCGSVLSHTYPELLDNSAEAKRVAGKIVDFQKLVAELGVEKIFGPTKNPGRKIRVTYHDPCHLKRGMDVYREPRTILRDTPGVDFVEMENADRCCGGPGAFSLTHYDAAMEYGRLKAEAIVNSGAEMVVTSCPSCQLQLADALRKFGADIPVTHTADLVAAIGKSRGDPGQTARPALVRPR